MTVADSNVELATREREEGLRTLWTDAESGLGAPVAAAPTGARLHRCQRGNVSLLVLFMGLVFYTLTAMTWNTGELTSAKIEAQTAADSAAYTSAVWTSRAVNMIAATNPLALRDASAIGIATAALIEGIWVFGFQTLYFIQNIVPLLSGLPWTLPAIMPLLAAYMADLVLWIDFVIDTGWPVMPIYDMIVLGFHLHDLVTYQGLWVSELPMLIAAQEAQLEAYYDCDVQLRLGNGSPLISPPLHRGTPITCAVPLILRYLYDGLASGSWYQEDTLKLMVIGRGKTGWLVGWAGGLLTSTLALSFQHHVLKSQPQYSPLEFGPYGTGFITDPRTWADFTVVASARKRTSNESSKQLPRYPLRFMAPGVFGDGDEHRPVAYAQAETFNGIDGLISTVNIGGFNLLQPVLSIYPWRVWTDWGWQWQPRLTHGTLIHPSLFQGTDVGLIPFGRGFNDTVPTH